MIDIKNFFKLSLYLPISFVLNILIILVFIERRNNSAFDSFFFYYCIITTCYFIVRSFIFASLYLKQRKENHLAKIEDDKWPGLTVIVPAYNEEDVIELTLKSLLEVDYPMIKIIVVDDGSTDKTGRLVKEIANNKILYLRQENKGKAQALTNGINHVNTEYTMMVDADCIFPSDSFKKAIQYITYYGDDAIGGVLLVANPQLTIAKMQVMEYVEDLWLFRIFQNHFQCIKSDRTQDVIPGAVGLFLTKSLKSVGPLSNDFLAEDVDLTAQLVERYYRLSFCPYLVCYTVVPETLKSLNKQRKRWSQGYLQVVIARLSNWTELNTRSRYHILFMLIRILYWPITFTLSWCYVIRSIFLQDWYFIGMVLLAQFFPFTLSGLIQFCNYDLKSNFLYSFAYNYFLLFNRTYYQIQLLFYPQQKWEKYSRFAKLPKKL